MCESRERGQWQLALSGCQQVPERHASPFVTVLPTDSVRYFRHHNVMHSLFQRITQVTRKTKRVFQKTQPLNDVSTPFNVVGCRSTTFNKSQHSNTWPEWHFQREHKRFFLGYINVVSRRLIGLPLRVVDQELTLLRGLLWETIQLVGSVNKLNQNFLDSSEKGTPAPSLSSYLHSPNKVGKTDNNIQNKSTYLWLPPTRMAILLSATEASIGWEPLLMPRCILTLSSGLFYI